LAVADQLLFRDVIQRDALAALARWLVVPEVKRHLHWPDLIRLIRLANVKGVRLKASMLSELVDDFADEVGCLPSAPALPS
jgi:hypothetical protein